MKLAYEAYDRMGKTISDVIDAPNQEDAAERLRRKGLYVLQLNPISKRAAAKKTSTSAGRFRYGKNLKNLATFTRQISVLVSSGMQIADVLSAMERQMSDERWKQMLGRLRTRVEEGDPLSSAMKEHPQYFDNIYCSLISAGETSGKLPGMLDRLANLAQQRSRVYSTVVGALVYPCVLITISLGVLLLMLMVVLPRFGELFESLDVPLPAATTVMLLISGFLRSYWWLVFLGLAGLPFLLRVWLRTDNAKRSIDSFLIRTPKLRLIVRNFATARLARLLGILLDSHLPLLDVLALVRDSTKHGHYAAMLQRAEEAVTQGEPISTAFNDTTLIDPAVYEAIRSGEQSGSVGFVLLHMADFMDEENDVVVRTLTSIIEPIILVFLGVLVGIVALSMFLPLFDLTSMTGGGAA